MKKLLIFDGNSIINRAFYAVRPLTNRAGLNTNALFGFVNILKKHLDREAPDYAAIAFDVHAPTFRHKHYDGYKATRKPMPEELREQMPYAHRLAEALGLVVLEFEGYEADDILGAASRLAENEGAQAVLVTGDRDALQLVSEMTTVMLCTTGKDVPMTPGAIQEKYGVTPQKLIDVKSLMGDTSDNIPGVRGIGEKSALSLIRASGDLDTLYASLEDLSLTPSVKQKLTDGRESAYLSRFLATILRELPGLDTLPALTRKEPDKAALSELFLELEFTRLAAAFGLNEAAPAPAAPPQSAAPGQITLDTLISPAEPELTPLKPLSLTALTDTAPVFALVSGGELFLRQGETEGKLASGDIPAFAARFAPVVFDAKRYFHFCVKAGADPDKVQVKDDLQLMAYLIDPSGAAASLSRTATVFLSRFLPAEPHPATELSVLSSLWDLLPARLVAEGMGDLYREMELPLARILFEMEYEGILLDRAGLLAYGEELKGAISALENAVYEAAGETLNLNSPKQLGRLLFETLGLPHAKKTKTGYSTDAETLEKLRPYSPLVADLLEYRKLSKLYSTYIEGLAKQTETDARVHTTFLQAQTVTGRLSSADPNLQNIPVRTEEGRQIRRYFIAKEGCVLLDADYSQVELRILAHLSGDEAFLAAFRRGEDIHKKTAASMFGVREEEVTPEMRKDAKAINFGIVYGIGDYSLSQDLGISVKSAGEYIRSYFAAYPDVKAYLDRVKEDARASGEVTTLYGRRRKVPELAAAKKTLVAFGERVAMNTPIQGTAADIMKLAMVRVAERLKQEGRKARILLQVHDELLLECPESEKEAVKALLKEEMEGAANLSVTLSVEVGEGKNWLDAK